MFVLSVVGLAVLFTIKAVELERGVLFAARPRRRADVYAMAIKILIQSFSERLENTPTHLLTFGRFLVHIAALGFARVARAVERSSYKIADRVSHRHGFERGETRSSFLKSVSDHKSTLDTRV
ncbi:MAG: hypothetical protein AAB421_05545 [Patescibacteria group bacterium]